MARSAAWFVLASLAALIVVGCANSPKDAQTEGRDTPLRGEVDEINPARERMEKFLDKL